MVRAFFCTFFLMVSLESRENPFFPSAGEKDLPYTTNKKTKLPNLKRASMTLPSHARIIKKVTVEYESLDASIENKSVELNHLVDWHLPIFISQNFAETANKQQVVSKKKRVQKKKNPYKKVAAIKHAKFFVSKKSLKIVTKDKLIRNFLLGQPHRIVMDFKRESNLKSYIKDLSSTVFKKIRVGNHDGYYRVVIELDGFYKYKLKKQPNGCLVTLL